MASMIFDLPSLLNTFKTTNDIFKGSISLQPNQVPFKSLINLDNGLIKFDEIVVNIIKTNFPKTTTNIVQQTKLSIASVKNNIDPLIKEWMNLFGVENVSQDSYKSIINTIASLTPTYQQMLTNPLLLKEFLKKAVDNFKTKINNLTPQQNAELITVFRTNNAQQIIVNMVEKYIEPNIGYSVTLFYELLPIQLMFLIFSDKYENIIKAMTK